MSADILTYFITLLEFSLCPHSFVTPACCSAGRTGHTPGTGCSPSVAPAMAGSSWRQATGDEGDRDNDGSADDRDAADSERSLVRRRREHREEGLTNHWLHSCFSFVCRQRLMKPHFIYLEACRCQATAAAPSPTPSAWSTRSHDPRSPTGCEPPDLRGASARREWSPRRTALTDRFNTRVWHHRSDWASGSSWRDDNVALCGLDVEAGSC